jgi:glycosyltransferase involved in cell wall biosynthesis
VAHQRPFTTAYHTDFPGYVQARFGFMGQWPARLTMLYLRRFHQPAQAVLASTPRLCDDLSKIIPSSLIQLMTRGVDFNLFTPDGPRAALPTTNGPVALYVGRVAIEKNLRAFLNMPFHGTKVIVGDGPLLAKYRADYPQVIFTGAKTGADLARYYRSADVFVFPSKTDTFGLVLIEAMACGLPIAAYPVQGPLDILTDPSLGLMNDDLQAAVEAVLNQECPELRRARVDHVRQHYRWELAAQQFLMAASPSVVDQR